MVEWLKRDRVRATLILLVLAFGGYYSFTTIRNEYRVLRLVEAWAIPKIKAEIAARKAQQALQVPETTK